MAKTHPILDQVTQQRRQLLQDVAARRKRFVTSATSRFARLDSAIQACHSPDSEPDQEPEIELPIRASAEMRKHRTSYRTTDGNADYSFLFEEQADGSWRAYIERQTSYRGRATDAHSTHRLSDANRQYVCWTSSLDSLEDAKQVAALWADKTQDYIRTGVPF